MAVIVWWKEDRVLWSSAQLKETGLIDHLLYVERRPYLEGQLKLWIGKP